MTTYKGYDKEKLVKYNTYQKMIWKNKIKYDYLLHQSEKRLENIEKRLNELVTAVIMIEKRLDKNEQ